MSSPVASAAPAWRSRITGSGTEAPGQLLANPSNWRVHPKAQQRALGGVLDQVGWVQQILVNQRTGHLVDVSLAERVTKSLADDTSPSSTAITAGSMPM